jgi:hypothetical protein
MNKKQKRLAVSKTFLVVLALALALGSCGGLRSLDVVGKDSVRAFGDVLAILPAEEYEPRRWKWNAPGGGAWLTIDNMNVSMVVDAAPFAAAGADLSKLENAAEHNINPGKTSIFFASGGMDMLNENGEDTALAQFRADIAALRADLNYHTSLDHYGIKFGGGNMFEWAKDLQTNGYDDSPQDKDVVFVLNPGPLLAAGLEPEKVEGWAYAQVTVEENGKPEQVWKLLKSFDLK